LTERNRALLNETAETFGQQIVFYDASPYIKDVNSEAVARAQIHDHSLGALFRLLIPEILTFDKVIYLDCDIVVNMDIQELWNVCLDGCSLAGALDRPIDNPYRRLSSRAFEMKLMKCERATYINSGVLYMNLSRIREKFRLSQQGASWYKRYGHCSSLVDQDLINSCFFGDIKIIDSRFNNCHAHDGDISNSILHAITAPKPWDGPKGSALDRLYWKTYLKTPWGRLAPDEVVDLMLDVVKKSPVTHRRTWQCYRAIFLRLWKDVFLNDVVVIAWLAVKGLYYRMKFSLTQRTIEKI
jgi:lipopolysaccharide biosynthesis glycosyltransferase